MRSFSSYIKGCKNKSFTAIVFIIVFLFIAAAWFAFNFINFHTVIENSIYRSAQLTDNELKEIINNYQVRSILNLRGINEDSSWYRFEKSIAEERGINYYTIDLSAKELPPVKELNRLVHFLTHAPKPLLLHCHAGADRAGMVSALALVILNDTPLASAKYQFSWRYRVIPWKSSIGNLFFSRYEEWLAATGKHHSKDVMLSWINYHYRDAQGNVAICSDSVNNVRFARHRKNDKRAYVTIKHPDVPLVVKGWAFDGRTLQKANGLVVSIEGIGNNAVEYLYERPDVAKVYDFREKNRTVYLLGWRAVIQGIQTEGCHQIIYTIGEERIKMPYSESICFSHQR